MDRFSALAKERLGWYVYLLRDPRTGEIFYIGKGRGDRAFQHEAAATSAVDHPELQSAKSARINEITAAGSHVQVDVLRHGISSEPQAYEVESAAIDLVNLLSPATLLNVVLGHHHAQRGLMTAEEIEVLHAAPPAPRLLVPVILVSLNKLWRPDATDAELEDITKVWWNTRGVRRDNAKYVFGVHNGVVRTIYRPHNWHERVEGDRDWEDDIGKSPRWGFDPAPAPVGCVWDGDPESCEHRQNDRIRFAPRLVRVERRHIDDCLGCQLGRSGPTANCDFRCEAT